MPADDRGEISGRRALDPSLLRPADILALQRDVGNQAVLRMLDRQAATIEPTDGRAGEPAIVQRVKTEEERSSKQRRVANARLAISTLSGKIKDNLRDHIFDAKPIKGGNVAPANPQGLHAYKNGRLPGFVQVQSTTGSPGRVHEITWRHAQGTTEKKSTMFPNWMPADHVKTLIAVRYADDTSVVKEKIDLGAEGIRPEDVKKYISRGQDIKLGKSGDTVYPEM